MTNETLKDSWLRFRRGQQLKYILVNKVGESIANSKLEFIEKRDSNYIEFYVKFQDSIEVEINLLLSEIAHNWRSALDNAVYSICASLLEEEVFTEKEHKIKYQFPNDDTFKLNDEKIRYYPSKLLELFNVHSPITQNKFVYQHLDSDAERENFTKDQICSPIMHLQRLSNDDKHKFLNLAKFAVTDIGLANISGNIPLELQFGRQGLKSGEILARFRNGDGIDSKPFATLKLQISLSKCRQDSHELIDFIEDIERWVQVVLNELASISS